MFQFPHRISVIFLDELVGEADGGFDEFLHGRGQELVDVFVIIVVVSNAEDHVDVVPNGSSEHERVNINESTFFKFAIPELAKRISRQKPVKCSFLIRYDQ